MKFPTVIFFLCRCAVAVKISKETEHHIEKCIEIHEADTAGVMLGTVIQPPLCLPGADITENHFLLPKVIIWDPLKRYPLTCPTHQNELKPSFWFGKQQIWRQPRMLYDLNDNVLLVGRYYVCSPNKNCRYVSMDDHILAQLPPDLHIPFLLFHRSGCTRKLVEHVYTLVAEGRTFIDICSKLNALNYEHLYMRVQKIIQHGLGKATSELKELVGKIISSFRTLEIFNAPSRTLLEALFLQDFKIKRNSFASEMRTLSAGSLSVSIFTFDNQWSEQYRYLILVCNEHRQVVTWAFSRSYDFEEIRPLFEGLHLRLSTRGVRPKVIHINHCCEWRIQLQMLFSVDTQQPINQTLQSAHQSINPVAHIIVKQDLFQIIRSVMSTMPKKGSTGLDRNLFQRDFSLVFRQEDDGNDDRLKSTPAPQVIQANLDKFIKRWETLGNCELLNPQCRKQLEVLKGHISNGCFSFIAPGDGTEGNRKLLSILQTGDDNILAHAKHLGPELLFAVLTVLFHYWNKSNEPHKVSTAFSNMLLGVKRFRREKDTEDENDYSKFVSQKEVAHDRNHIDVSMFFPEQNNATGFSEPFGFIGQTNMSSFGWTNSSFGDNNHASSLRYATNIEDMLVSTTSRFIITEMLDLHEVLQNIGKLSAEVTVNSFQLAHAQLHNMLYLLAAKSSDANAPADQALLKEQSARLDAQLSNFKLQRVPIEGDGDCAFASIIYQLEQILLTEHNEKVSALHAHITHLGLSGTLEEKIFRLRALFVNEILNRKEDYMLQYTNFMSVEQFQLEAEKFRYPQVFSGQLGDLVIKVLSIILHCPIAVITSMEGVPLVPFIPEKPLIKTPLFIAFTQHGPGHYDGTCPREASQNDTENPAPEEEEDSSVTPCRCGYNNAKKDAEKLSCTNVTREDKTKYKTRCPCFKNGRDCSNCACVNCGNEYNPPEILCNDHKLLNCRKCGKKPAKSVAKTASVRRKRKRAEVGPNIGYLASEDANLSGNWTEFENCLFEVIHSLLCSTCVMVSVENIWKVFNFVCSDPANLCLGLEVKTKSLKSVHAKFEQRKMKLASSLQKADTSIGIEEETERSKPTIHFPTEQDQTNSYSPIVSNVQPSTVPIGNEMVHMINSVQEAQTSANTLIPPAHMSQTVTPSGFTPVQPPNTVVTPQTHSLSAPDSMRYIVPTQVPAHLYMDSFKNVVNGQAIPYTSFNSQVQYVHMTVPYQSMPPNGNIQDATSHDPQETQGVNLSQNAVPSFTAVNSVEGVRDLVTDVHVQQLLNVNTGT